VFIFKDTEPSPLQLSDSSGVRQKGGLPGPPPRNPSPRIHRCPGGLYRGSIAHRDWQLGPSRLRTELFSGTGIHGLWTGSSESPGPGPGQATESHHVVNHWHDSLCVECLFLRSPGRVPSRTPSACAKRAAYPDPPPVILLPESIAAQATVTVKYIRSPLRHGNRYSVRLLGQNCRDHPFKVRDYVF
jgi:hypothetical protein